MISYYDLLTMIKAGNIPEKVKFDGDIYKWNGVNYFSEDDFGYLTDDKNEADMLKKDIEIIINDKKIEKLKIENDDETHFYIKNEYGTKCGLTKHSKIIADKINEIIEVLNEKEKIQDNKK